MRPAFSDKLFFLNVHGCHIIHSDILFYEDELFVKNVNWIEYEHLVVFDLYYPVYQEIQHVICYYGPDDDLMVWKGKTKKWEGQFKLSEEDLTFIAGELMLYDMLGPPNAGDWGSDDGWDD